MTAQGLTQPACVADAVAAHETWLAGKCWLSQRVRGEPCVFVLCPSLIG